MTAYRNLLRTLATTCAIGTSALSAAQTLSCPPRFPTTSVQFGPVGGGWTAAAGDLAAPLESMGLFSGPPSQGAALQPTTAKGQTVTWSLEPPYPGGLWLQCAYGRNSLTLSKPLPNIPKVCIAKYGKESRHQPRVIEFSCR